MSQQTFDEFATRFFQLYEAIVGDQDKHCYDTSLKVTDMLKAHDIPCKLEVYPNMGHDFPPDFEQKLTEAIAFILEG